LIEVNFMCTVRAIRMFEQLLVFEKVFTYRDFKKNTEIVFKIRDL